MSGGWGSSFDIPAEGVAAGGCKTTVLGDDDPDNPTHIDWDQASETVLSKLNDQLIEYETLLTRITMTADGAISRSRSMTTVEAARYRGDALAAIRKLASGTGSTDTEEDIDACSSLDHPSGEDQP